MKYILIQYEQRVKTADDCARIGHQVFLIRVAEHGDKHPGRVQTAPYDRHEDDERAEYVLQVDEDGEHRDEHDGRERVAQHGERGRQRHFGRVGHRPQQAVHARRSEHGQAVYVAEHELAAGQQQQRRVREVERDRADHVVIAQHDAALAGRVQRVQQPRDDLADVDAELLEQRRFVLLAREARGRARGLPRRGQMLLLVQLGRLRVTVETVRVVVGVRTGVEVEIVVGHEIRVVRMIVLVRVHRGRSRRTRASLTVRQTAPAG